MDIYDELGNLIQRIADRAAPVGRKGRIGFAGPDGTYQTQVEGKPGVVWVRLNDTREVVQAINLQGVTPEPDMPVIVGTPPGSNRLHVLRVDPDAADALSRYIAGAPPWHTHEAGSLYDIVSARRIRPGRVTPYKDPLTGRYDFRVWIEPHFHSGGYWEGGVIDLSSYKPAGPNEHRWVLVGIDEISNTAFAEPGPVQGRSIPLAPSQLAEIEHATGTGYCGVVITDTDTDLSSETKYVDRTHWRSKVGTGINNNMAIYSRWDPDAPPETPGELDDEFDDETLGAAWAEWDWGNLVTASEGLRGLRLQSASTATRLGGVYISKPSGTDWSVWTKVNLRQANISSCTAGIAVLEDAGVESGDVKFLSVETKSDGFYLMHQNWSQWDTFSSTPIQRKIEAGFGHLYLRVRYFGSTGQLWFDYSLNGEGWLALASMTLWPQEFKHIALVISNYAADGLSEAYFEFFRSYQSASFSDFPGGRLVGVGNSGIGLGTIQASSIAYAPENEEDWTDPDPTNVQDALDALAARETGGGGGTPTTISAVVEQIITSGTLDTSSAITLSSIPDTYDELRLEIVGYPEADDDASVTVVFNNDTTITNYRDFNLACQGDYQQQNSQVIYTTEARYTIGRITYNWSIPSRTILTLRIPRYSTSDPYKLCEYRFVGMGTNEYESLVIGTLQWSSSSAISQISVGPTWGGYGYTTYTLYGRRTETLVTGIT